MHNPPVFVCPAHSLEVIYKSCLYIYYTIFYSYIIELYMWLSLGCSIWIGLQLIALRGSGCPGGRVSAE